MWKLVLLLCLFMYGIHGLAAAAPKPTYQDIRKKQQSMRAEKLKLYGIPDEKSEAACSGIQFGVASFKAGETEEAACKQLCEKFVPCEFPLMLPLDEGFLQSDNGKETITFDDGFSKYASNYTMVYCQTDGVAVETLIGNAQCDKFLRDMKVAAEGVQAALEKLKIVASKLGPEHEVAKLFRDDSQGINQEVAKFINQMDSHLKSEVLKIKSLPTKFDPYVVIYKTKFYIDLNNYVSVWDIDDEVNQDVVEAIETCYTAFDDFDVLLSRVNSLLPEIKQRPEKALKNICTPLEDEST